MPYLPMSHKGKAVASFIFISIAWGSTWPISKLAIQEVPVFTVAYLRNIIAGSILVAYFLFKGYHFPSARQMLQNLCLSLLMFTINTLCCLYSITLLPIHIAAIIGCTSPLVLLLLSFKKNKNISLLPYLLGCITSIIGIGILLWENKAVTENFLLGVVISFIGIFSWCIGYLRMEKLKNSLPIYYSFAWQLILSSFTIFAISLFINTDSLLFKINKEAFAYISFLAIVGSAISFICLGYLIKHTNTAKSSLYVYLNPIIASIISMVLMQQAFSYKFLIGGSLVLAGVGFAIHTKSPTSKVRP